MIDTIRYWKEVGYREWVHVNFSQEEIDAIPKHPSGYIELDDDELVVIAGGGYGSMNGRQQRVWPEKDNKPKPPTDKSPSTTWRPPSKKSDSRKPRYSR